MAGREGVVDPSARRRVRRRALVGLVAGLALLWPSAGGAERSYIPIPEIITDPNEGNTIGILGVALFTDEYDRIQYMIAPDVRYNKTTGVFPTFRLFGYPTPKREYSLVFGKSSTRDENYELKFEDRGYWEDRAFVIAHAGYEQDSTERFFGFGNDSKEGNESNYTSQVLDMAVEPGVWILPHVNLSYRMRILRRSLQHGQVSSIPFIGAPRFLRDPETDTRGRGLEPGLYWSHRVAFTYDSRDSLALPTQGGLALVYADAADRRLGSATSYFKFGFESRKFIPFRAVRNPVLAMRALVDYVSGSGDTPFWQMSSLGGRRALRAFGGDRFIDFNRSLASAELRTRVYSRRLFGTMTELELAPFLETGQVFHHVTDSPVNDLHWAYGLGFRGLARPQIVAFVDVGRGSEGLSIFTGIDYPF